MRSLAHDTIPGQKFNMAAENNIRAPPASSEVGPPVLKGRLATWNKDGIPQPPLPLSVASSL